MASWTACLVELSLGLLGNTQRIVNIGDCVPRVHNV